MLHEIREGYEKQLQQVHDEHDRELDDEKEATRRGALGHDCPL
jgi:hypothetical protein